MLQVQSVGWISDTDSAHSLGERDRDSGREEQTCKGIAGGGREWEGESMNEGVGGREYE